MTDIIKVLQRSFTTEFYRLNLMFFLLICGLAFGFMSSVEHRALAEFITSTPALTIIPAALWLLYGIKINSFNNQVCRMKEMTFLRLLSLTSISTQLFCVLTIVFNQFIPAIAYGSFLIIWAIKNQLIISAVCIALSLLFLLVIFTFLLYRRIGSIDTESRVSFIKIWIDRNFQKSFTQFFTEWLARNHPGIILTSKISGSLLLFAACQLYKYDDYDYRLLTLGSLAAFGSSMLIVHQYVLFENHRFQMLRNLPILLSKRMIHFVICMTFLCLPEFIVLVRNYPSQLPSYFFIEISVFILSLYILGYSILLKIKNVLENFSGRAFIAFMTLVVLILFSVPLYALTVVPLIAAVLIYKKGFYEFEVIGENVGTPSA